MQRVTPTIRVPPMDGQGSEQPIDIIRGKMETLLSRVGPKSEREGLRHLNSAVEIGIHPKIKSLQFNFPHRECVALLNMTADWPPLISIRGLCWEFHQQGVCRHMAAAL